MGLSKLQTEIEDLILHSLTNEMAARIHATQKESSNLRRVTHWGILVNSKYHVIIFALCSIGSWSCTVIITSSFID